MSESSGPDGPQNAPADTSGSDQAGTPSQRTGEKPSRSGAIIGRYGQMRYLGQFRHNLDTRPLPGKKMVVRTDRGVELAEVVANLVDDDNPFTIVPDRLAAWLKENGENYPFRRNGRVLRAATPQDLIDFRHLESSADSERSFCRKLIKDLGLEMKLVSVEHLLGGERIIFYFTAEHRVDFRELVKQLAAEYRTRIEMRQVGARDEARLVADMERCGQVCCCQQYLKELKPVSMRMAKVQKATLDPPKIPGRCGRLMCCPRHEDPTYVELPRQLPKRKTWVRTQDELVAKVRPTQIITQLVRLQLPDGTFVAVPNEDIIEQDIGEPDPNQPAPKPAPAAPEPADEQGPDLQSSDSQDEGESESKSRRRRPRRRKTRRSSGKGASGQAEGASDKGDKAGKSRRRRRRRRKKPKGGSSSSATSSGGGGASDG